MRGDGLAAGRGLGIIALVASTVVGGTVWAETETKICPDGSAWHEEADLAAHPLEPGVLPGRVGWCRRPDGQRHGAMRVWWPNGTLQSESTFVDGAAEGPARTWFDNGRLHVESQNHDGRTEGRYVLWHPTGQRSRIMHYEAGRPHGWATYWDEKGRLVARGTFVDGRKEGVWETQHSNGLLREVARWAEGRLSGRQLMFSEGGVFSYGACWEAGEKQWESKNEAESRTRRCSPW